MPDTIENTPAELVEPQEDAQDAQTGQTGHSGQPPEEPQDDAQDAREDAQDDAQDAQEDAQTFPRAYVEKLRQEAADARVRAKRADDLARELFTARVAATGRLADPNDLPFDDALLADMPALEAAIDELVAQHPHYAARRPRGDIGQGATASDAGTVDLAGLLRARA